MVQMTMAYYFIVSLRTLFLSHQRKKIAAQKTGSNLKTHKNFMMNAVSLFDRYTHIYRYIFAAVMFGGGTKHIGGQKEANK